MSLGAGTSTITATCEGITGSATVTVLSQVALVTASLGTSTLVVGGSTTATAVTRDSSNNVMTGRTVHWSSSNPMVATVNPSTGAVVGVSVGTSEIVAMSEGVSGAVKMTVIDVPVATVGASLLMSLLYVGVTTRADAVTRDASNNILSDRATSWSSSNPAVATVNASTGAVVGLSVGTASITATSEGITGSATVTVTHTPVATASVSLRSLPLKQGATYQATAVLRDAANNVLKARVIVWSSSNPSVATVNPSTGLVAGGTSIGSTNITATSEGISSSINVTLVDGPRIRWRGHSIE